MRRPADQPPAHDTRPTDPERAVVLPGPAAGTDQWAAVADAAVAAAEAVATAAAAEVAREAVRTAEAAVDAACAAAAKAAQRAQHVAADAAEAVAAAAAVRASGRAPSCGASPLTADPDDLTVEHAAHLSDRSAEAATYQRTQAELVARRVVIVAEAAAAAALDAARVVADQLRKDTAAVADDVACPARSDTGAAVDLRQVTQVPRVSTRVRASTVGLVLVLVVLTVFSVTVSITNSRGAASAQTAATESDLFETALEALLAQEEAAEEVVAADDAETRSEYAAADLVTRTALRDLDRVAADAHGDVDVGRLRDAHVRYGVAVEAMFGVALQGPGAAELYEEAFVDLHFDPLAATLDAHVKTRYAEAHAALDSIARAQRLLQLATPLLFGGALVMLTTFIVMLGRSRRLVGAQADENRHQSLHDSLTGLPNRTMLHSHGTLCLQHSAATGTPTALMLLDLDRFKEINDTLGHHHGDLVLQAVSDRLRLAVRSTDVVVRLGGDEFAILLPQVRDITDALAVAAKVQEALRSSFDAGGILLDVDISMGVALSGVHGDDIDTLLQHADIAMYRAKENDLGVCVYDDALNEHSRDQLGLLGELRRAIDNDELVLHFQPKIALGAGGFCGAEALLRWDHPTRGMIPPGLFIPAAERTALIRPLTAWVLNAALAECKRWQDDGRPLKLAVNVSARNLLDDSFGDDVLELLARWDLPASCLLLEVTESAIMADPERAGTILRRFAKIGIEIAIDDFGAGYTSLAHLRTLPVQELKIDQSLVRQMSNSAADRLIITAIIDLAHRLGLRTVAEGVEDAESLERLRVMGCDVAQGYHLARPMPAAALRQWRQRDLPPLRTAAARA